MNILTNIVLAADIGEGFASPWGKSGGPGLADLFSLILTLGMSVAGLIVLFTFIFAGLNIIRGAGNGDPKSAAQGKQALTYAIAGLVVVATAYTIVKLVGIITGATLLSNPF